MKYKSYFVGRENIMLQLEMLHEKKISLKQYVENMKNEEENPYVVELAGLPRTGKSTIMLKLFDFFKTAGMKVVKAEEPAFMIKENLSREEIKKMGALDFNDKTLEYSRQSLEQAKSNNPDIIFMDRGIVDNYFWYQMLLDEKTIDYKTYKNRLGELFSDYEKINQLFVLTAASKEIITRDYINQLYLDERNKTTLERVEGLRIAYSKIYAKLNIGVENNNITYIDTTNDDVMETSISIADKVMDGYKIDVIDKRNPEFLESLKVKQEDYVPLVRTSNLHVEKSLGEVGEER